MARLAAAAAAAAVGRFDPGAVLAVAMRDIRGFRYMLKQGAPGDSAFATTASPLPDPWPAESAPSALPEHLNLHNPHITALIGATRTQALKDGM